MARLKYYGYDIDRPDAEGWIEVNYSPRIALPADEALDNAGRDFIVDVTGRIVTGLNHIGLTAFDAPEGSFYRISALVLELEGVSLDCEPPPPSVNGVERRINQRGEGQYQYVLHGVYHLSGAVVVVIDSTQGNGSDSVRHVLLRPASP